MVEDWRLQGQEKYLTGVELCRKRYRRTSQAWDHDHCEFCSEKFAEEDLIPDSLHEGYATPDSYRWICPQCFEDFKEQFQWRVVDGPPEDSK